MSKAIRDLIEAETLTFQDEEKLLTELDQLEADAELGRAVRKAYKTAGTHMLLYSKVTIDSKHSANMFERILWSEKELLEWAKGAE